MSISLLVSKTSENTNNSKKPDKSENLIIAYEVPFCVFFSWTLSIVDAIFEVRIFSFELNSS